MAEGDTGIFLTVKPLPRLTSVATLVAGGIGSRLSLPVDRIDDLQLAITTVLGQIPIDGEGTLRFNSDDSGVECLVGPAPPSVADCLPVVRPLVTSAEILEVDGDRWVRLLVASSPDARSA